MNRVPSAPSWKCVVLCSTMLGGAEVFTLERMREIAGARLHCNESLGRLVRNEPRYAGIAMEVEPALEGLAHSISLRWLTEGARALSPLLGNGGILLANLRAASLQLASAHARRNLAFIHDNAHYLNRKARLLVALIVARSPVVFFPCRHSTFGIPWHALLRRHLAVEYFDVFREPVGGGRVEAPLRVACVGRISPDKNTLGAVRIANALARRVGAVRLALLGNVLDARYAARLGAEATTQVELSLRQVPRSEMSSILRQQHLVLHASRIESLPLVLFEANACGVPFFAAPSGGIPEVLPERFLIDVENPDRAAQAIAAFFDGGTPSGATAAESAPEIASATSTR
jgi:glycosyltransferase involved in cell wall biosynthesis